jgi:hypothetical protein
MNWVRTKMVRSRYGAGAEKDSIDGRERCFSLTLGYWAVGTSDFDAQMSGLKI